MRGRRDSADCARGTGVVAGMVRGAGRRLRRRPLIRVAPRPTFSHRGRRARPGAREARVGVGGVFDPGLTPFGEPLPQRPPSDAEEGPQHEDAAAFGPGRRGPPLPGVADCLSGASECGRIIANAWCEAQGFSRAETFGLAVEDVTGSTAATISNRSERPISITCEN